MRYWSGKYLVGLMFVFMFLAFDGFGQHAKRVLFLGNSYTQVNNLPQILADVAASVGDSVVSDRSTPGGYTLQLHSTNASSLEKIRQGGWDMLVLQEQSQLPSYPIEQVITDVFPYARFLDSLFNVYNPCGETVFYRTWGRKNGDASNCSWWPPVCTYEGMDSLLQLRYMMMADSNHAIVSPVGAVWKYIRQYYPDIELYQMDESHPSQAGSYAAACSFYTAIFRKDPMSIHFDYTLSEVEAYRIRTAVKEVVFDNLSYWHVGDYDPIADFSYEPEELEVTFSNLSAQAMCYTWDFGDGEQSNEMDPVHSYPSSGTYDVRLIALGGGYSDTISHQITVGLTSAGDMTDIGNLTVFPNPVGDELQMKLPKGRIVRIVIVGESGVSQEMSFVIENHHLKVDFTQVSSGFYILKMETDTEERLLKVLKR